MLSNYYTLVMNWLTSYRGSGVFQVWFKTRVLVVARKAEEHYQTALSTWYDHYELVFMLLGLTNAPAAFIDLTHRIFRPYVDQFMIIFIDDLLVYQNPQGSMRDDLRIILQILREQKLYNRFINCGFWSIKVLFWEH